MSAFFVSFGLIFLAELGDKSQLVALWFATRYRWWLVIASVTLATLAVHLGSTAAGVWVSDVLPESLVLTLVGLSFFGFAAWSLRGDSIDGGRSPAGATGLGALGLITGVFFLSELGDKTQLATVSIAGEQEDFVAVWLGSTLGMVVADAVAIGVGSVAGTRIPERKLAIVAAAVFIIFGGVALAHAFELLLVSTGEWSGFTGC
jgi:putative Ca2+/H+ antiporter (TMEM165/GDT1 family)